MKKILSTLAALALAVTVQGQVTNLVKVSALPTAGALTGAEIVPMVQSGSTVSATLAQIQAAPQGFANSVSNLMQAQISNSVIFAAGVSNFLNAVSNTVPPVNANGVIVSNNAVIVSNRVNAIITADGTVSNSVVTVSNQVTTLLGNVATINGVTNGLQNQITALQVAQGATNGGTLALQQLQLTTFAVTPPVQVPSSQLLTNFVDFAKGANQYVWVGLGNSASVALFLPTNFVDGENVFLWVTVTNSIAGYVGCCTNTTGGNVQNWAGGFAAAGGTATQLTGSRKAAVLNWTVVKQNSTNNLIFTQSIAP